MSAAGLAPRRASSAARLGDVARLTRAGRSASQIATELRLSARVVVRYRALARAAGVPLALGAGPAAATCAPDADWRQRALCRDEDPELFFPDGMTGPALRQAEEAKAVCRRCPVAGDCLAWALETGQDAGVWGGLAEDERGALARSLARRAASGSPATRAPARTPARRARADTTRTRRADRCAWCREPLDQAGHPRRVYCSMTCSSHAQAAAQAARRAPRTAAL